MSNIDDDLNLSSIIKEEPLKEKEYIEFDKKENGDLYKGQLEHNQFGVMQYSGPAFLTLMRDKIYKDAWIMNSVQNVQFLSNHFSNNIILALCNDMNICKYLSSQISDRTKTDEQIYDLFYNACNHLLIHSRYGSGERFVDYVSNEDADIFIKKLSLIGLDCMKYYLSKITNAD